MTIPKTTSHQPIDKNRQPSLRCIYVSGLFSQQPAASAKHWFTLGHHLYNAKKLPVTIANLAFNHPVPLPLCYSRNHPAWEDTLAGSGTPVDQEFAAQVQQVDSARAAIEQDKQRAWEASKKQTIRAHTWDGSRRYGKPVIKFSPHQRISKGR